MAKKATSNDANLGFEAQLWAAADKLRGNMEPSDYKHVALGLIFLKYISDAFEAKRAKLLTEELADAEDPEEYLAENVFWVPKEARWSHLQAKAKQPKIGKDIDDAMLAIEARNASLKGVLPKDYARPALNKVCPSSNKWDRCLVLLRECFAHHFHVTRRVVDSANDVSR